MLSSDDDSDYDLKLLEELKPWDHQKGSNGILEYMDHVLDTYGRAKRGGWLSPSEKAMAIYDHCVEPMELTCTRKVEPKAYDVKTEEDYEQFLSSFRKALNIPIITIEAYRKIIAGPPKDSTARQAWSFLNYRIREIFECDLVALQTKRDPDFCRKVTERFSHLTSLMYHSYLSDETRMNVPFADIGPNGFEIRPALALLEHATNVEDMQRVCLAQQPQQQAKAKAKRVKCETCSKRHPPPCWHLQQDDHDLSRGSGNNKHQQRPHDNNNNGGGRSGRKKPRRTPRHN